MCIFLEIVACAVCSYACMFWDLYHTFLDFYGIFGTYFSISRLIPLNSRLKYI